MEVVFGHFIWSLDKEQANITKHGVNFSQASAAFLDSNRIIAVDEAHSAEEERFFCIGKLEERIVTVRFTYRGNRIRIFGAGFWRKGTKLYEKENRKE